MWWVTYRLSWRVQDGDVWGIVQKKKKERKKEHHNHTEVFYRIQRVSQEISNNWHVYWRTGNILILVMDDTLY